MGDGVPIGVLEVVVGTPVQDEAEALLLVEHSCEAERVLAPGNVPDREGELIDTKDCWYRISIYSEPRIQEQHFGFDFLLLYPFCSYNRRYY